MKRWTKAEYGEHLKALRGKMAEKGIDHYLILTDDFHASEYVNDYFKCREYISGFTGSAGTLVISQESAGLWTDSRYFLQAADQLSGTEVSLHKMGEDGVLSVKDYLKETVKDGERIGFDGRTVNGKYFDELKDTLGETKVTWCLNKDLVGEIWEDRPAFPAHRIYDLPVKYTGKSREDKLKDLREAMGQKGADLQLLASLDDIAWLYNFRSSDIAFNPVAMAYAVIGKEKSWLYLAIEQMDQDLKEALEKDNTVILPYLQVYEDLKKTDPGCRILLDPGSCNTALLDAIPQKVQILSSVNATSLAKGRKNETEMANERQAHIQDGVAVTKLLYWLKAGEGHNLIAEGKLTELGVAAKLLSLRAERPDFLDQSFDPIVASGAHGAIVHYAPTPESDIPVQQNTFLLMDTGGHYLQGTTDITRTALIGEATDEMKECYTAVLKGNLNLAGAVFKKGTAGGNLDVLAHLPLWELGVDFTHGTGHGVGYLLNVHEGPQRINLKDRTPLEVGMLTSDEPGLYLEGKFGIRHENLMLTVEGKKTEFGTFLRFETLTMVPFDRQAILTDRLTEKEKVLLNSYHARVREAISPYLTEEEKEWLRIQTEPV